MFKKKHIYGAVAAMLAVTTLASSVFAADITRNISIMVNGKDTAVTDVNGNTVSPILQDGTTYVPIRGVAEALDMNVSWDDANSTVIIDEVTEAPKYVFLFIGDGLSHVQTQLANYYLDAMSQDAVAPLVQDDISVSADRDLSAVLTSTPQLTYMAFEAAGITTTYDSTSFCPDSASTATSIATGEKTHSGTISVGEDLVTEYATMAEQMHDLGMKVGIVSSVTINHATPAAFYAHNASRNNYYEIGLDMIESGFEYFAGGAINKHDSDGTSIYDLAAAAGYTVVNADQAAAEALTAADGKIIITGEDTDGGALPYEFERDADMWALSDYVAKGIEVLDNDNGFFMMVEAGKIDWACHANDAYSAIGDTIAFSDAIAEAVAFYNEHPNETLIIVTGDHETGGMTIGYVGTWYDTFLAQLSSQTGSYDAINATITARVAEGASFDTVMADIEAFCGLTTQAGQALSLTDYEIAKLQTAYDVQFNGLTLDSELSVELYGGYKPVAITVMTLMNNKSGVDFTSTSHTGVTVGTYAQGVGAEYFNGFYDNTHIYDAVAAIVGLG